MQNSLDSDRETSRLFESLGAEPLAGSGFEEEQPDPEFSHEADE